MDRFSFNAQVKKKAINYKVWQDGFHLVILDNRNKISQRIRYIHNNPDETGFLIMNEIGLIVPILFMKRKRCIDLI